MSHPLNRPPSTLASTRTMHTSSYARDLCEHVKNITSPRTRSSPTCGSVETPSKTSGGLSLRNPEHRHRTIRDKREDFAEHLKAWALNHDSSAYFHGSISIHSQGAGSDEDVELGKSVSCILTDGSIEKSKRIVIRLFRSLRYNDHIRQEDMRGRKDVRQGQATLPYQMVIRSGSGWVPARQYFDKHYFSHRSRSRREKESVLQRSVSASSTGIGQRAGGHRSTTHDTTRTITTRSSPPAASTTSALQMDARSPESTSPMSNSRAMNTAASNVRRPRRASSSASNSGLFNSRRTAHLDISRDISNLSLDTSASSRQIGPCLPPKTVVKITPLFRPFLRLPQELQDKILFQAIRHTRVIDLTQTASSHPVCTSPITVSKLFRISKSINDHMVVHIFRSTNFHFGITGFTKFLWQLGPLNRGFLQHLTFNFGKASLLHCIRWMAPDPVWEMFEPPVSTNPPTLMYFWRCQLQELMKELNLFTLTIDVSDVPSADVPMLARIISTAMGSVEHIRVVNDNVHGDNYIWLSPQSTRVRFLDLQYPTWRELSLQYHHNYKYQRWHMKHILTLRDVDLSPILNTWMNKDADFFDS